MRAHLLVLVLAFLALGSWAMADEIIVEFTAGQYTIEDVENGEVIQMEGFGQGGSPGSPMLPSKIFNVALPPDVVLDSVSISVASSNESSVPGVFDISPNGAPATWRDDEMYLNWGNATNIVDGRDMDVYGSDEFWPVTSTELLPPGQMRKWKFARVQFQPVRYNPVSRQLVLCEEISMSLKFERDPDLRDESRLADNAMDDLAATVLVNYHSARSWYGLAGNHFAPLNGGYNYVIITTEAIYSGSGTMIAAYKAHLEGLPAPYSVLIVTESHSYGDSDVAGGYGSKTGQSPNGTAEKIRQWLIDNESNMGIYYVLLIGDPNPSTGAVPMKICYPEGTGSGTMPTDYFYADLTGNWNLDGDSYFGEYNGDRGTGGVDFWAEVYVARIPVYGTAYSTLDGILQKVINYESADGDLSWRRSTLMPMSILNDPTGSYPGGDTSYVGHQIKANILQGRSFSTYEMYERRGTGCDSYYAPDQNLVANAVRAHWGANHYGMIWWAGHGDKELTVTGYGSGNCTYGYYLLNKTDCAAYLDDDYPAFVYQGSCKNAWPEASENLAYSVLKHGGVNTVAATRSAYYISSPQFHYSYKYYGIGYIAYYYADYLTQYGSYGAAESLFRTKYMLNSSYTADGAWRNFMIVNMYGCPQTRIKGQGNTYIRLSSFEAHARADKIVLTWETGAEVDNVGFVIYRFDGKERKAISRLIDAQGGPGVGASYTFVDTNVRRGVRYQYWLVDIDTNGKWTAHGPVGAGLPSPIERPVRSMREARIAR